MAQNWLGFKAVTTVASPPAPCGECESSQQPAVPTRYAANSLKARQRLPCTAWSEKKCRFLYLSLECRSSYRRLGPGCDPVVCASSGANLGEEWGMRAKP
eukprot:1963465-Rhodomonas_salina.1